MPDVPIKPPNKKVDEKVTELTLKVSEMFEHEKNFVKRYSQIITYLTRQLAEIQIKLEENEK
jgi:hypothetical protein